MVSSGTVQTTPPQGGSSKIRYNLDSPDPVSKVHGALDSSHLPSTSGRLPRATVTAYNVLGVLWTLLINNLKQGFVISGLGFFYWMVCGS